MGILGPAGSLGATLPGVGWHKAFLVEWLLSFVLMLVIMAVATDERVPEGFAGLAVGLTVGFCALMGGPLTGASMNPARSFGPAVVGGPWTAHWLYWAAPITGMIAAGWTYGFLRFAGPTAEAAEPLGIEGPISSELSRGRRASRERSGAL
jgi:aquaporin Z